GACPSLHTGLAGAVRHGASPGSGRVDVAQRTEQPARALVGAGLRRTVAVALGARLFALRLAPGARGLVFDIQRLRHRGRAARIRQPGDLDLEELASPLHAQGVAHAHRARSLGPLAAELDLAGVDGLPGQRARPEEARGPQPQIEADRLRRVVRLFHGAIVSAAREGAGKTPRRRENPQTLVPNAPGVGRSRARDTGPRPGNANGRPAAAVCEPEAKRRSYSADSAAAAAAAALALALAWCDRSSLMRAFLPSRPRR